MSNRRIDDHSFWAGKRTKYSVLPDETAVKAESSAVGAGSIDDYPDTTEDILRDQDEGIQKTEKQRLRTGYRY